MGERIVVSDDEWALIGPLLPAERGRLSTRGRQPALLRGHGVDGADGRAVAAVAGRVRQVEQRLPAVSATSLLKKPDAVRSIIEAVPTT